MTLTSIQTTLSEDVLMSVQKEFTLLSIKLTSSRRTQHGSVYKSVQSLTIYTVLLIQLIQQLDCVSQPVQWWVALSTSHKMWLKVVWRHVLFQHTWLTEIYLIPDVWPIAVETNIVTTRQPDACTTVPQVILLITVLGTAFQSVLQAHTHRQ